MREIKIEKANMLSMVNSSSERSADVRPTTTSHEQYHTNAAIDQENYVEHKSIAVPVLVKHEEYTAAEDKYRAQHHESSSILDTRVTRGALAASTNTNANATGGGESDTSAKNRKEKRSTKSKCPPGLRSGKWTSEEEAFTNMIIHYFKRGLLHVEDGTSLRWYLAKRLNCEAMRVTKKLKGNSSIGKQIFRALENNEENRQAIAHANDELAVVENLFLDSLASSTHATTSGTSSGLIAAQAAAASLSSSSSASARSNKKSSPHKPSAMLKPPNLEARKMVVPKAKSSYQGFDDLRTTIRANSEDAKLLLHFFVEAHDTMMDTATMEKKRLFSEVDSSQSSSTSSDSRADDVDSPPSKRHSVKIENLMV